MEDILKTLKTSQYFQPDRVSSEVISDENLKNLINSPDPNIWIPAAEAILLLQHEDFTLESLGLFLACMSRVVEHCGMRYISDTIEHEIRRVLYKLNELIFSDMMETPEKEIALSYTANWILKNKKQLEDYDGKWTILSDYETVLSSLKQMEERILNLERSWDRNYDIKYDTIIEKSINSVCSLETLRVLDLVGSYFSFITRKIKILTNDELKNSLLCFFESFNNHGLKISQGLCKMIDEKLMPNYFNFKQILNKNYYSQIEDIIQHHGHEAIQQLEFNYNKTLCYDIPELDSVCEPFLIKFLNAYSVIFSYLKMNYNAETPMREFILLSTIIRKITSYPKEYQYIIFEVMQGISSEKIGYIDYLFTKLPFKIKFRRLKPSWREKFNKRALGSPFKDKLGGFIRTKHDTLENLLGKAIQHVYILELPSCVSGITLNNKFIAISLFTDPKNKKGATFFVYLHELAHYLRRSDCITIEQSILPRSIESPLEIFDDELNACNESKGNNEVPSDVADEEEKDSQLAEEQKEIHSAVKPSTKKQSEKCKKQITEGGQKFEYRIFGELYKEIRTPAAKFLFEDNNLSLDAYMKRFKELNKLIGKGSTGTQVRMESDDPTSIGSCGCRYGEPYFNKAAFN